MLIRVTSFILNLLAKNAIKSCGVCNKKQQYSCNKVDLLFLQTTSTRSGFSTNWTLLVIHSGWKSRYCMSLSRFLNICRPVSAEWTSIILTFPAEIWVGEGEGDKDESVTREKEKQQSRKRERHTSPVTLIQPHATRGWWLFGQRRKQEGKGKMGKIRKCWGWRGVCTLEASPYPLFTSIHNSTAPTHPPPIPTPRAQLHREDNT